MTQIVTWGSCPVCGDCGELTVKIEHIIDGWSNRPMHRYTCPDCGEHSAIVLYDCPNCPPTRKVKTVTKQADMKPTELENRILDALWKASEEAEIIAEASGWTIELSDTAQAPWVYLKRLAQLAKAAKLP